MQIGIWAFQHSNDGAIYLFENSHDVTSTSTFPLRAHSEKHQDSSIVLLPRDRKSTTESRYGYAIANLGKTNGDADDCEDFAVGSPFEGNDGVVYVYFGNKRFWRGEKGIYSNIVTFSSTQIYTIQINCFTIY